MTDTKKWNKYISALNMPRKVVAEKAGVSLRTITYLENDPDREPRKATVLALKMLNKRLFKEVFGD